MRQIAVLSALLGLSLLGAYVSWTSDESDSSETAQVAIYHADASDISGITWSGTDESVRIERKSDAAGDYTWITVTETVEVRPEPLVAPTPEEDEGEGDEADDGSEGDAGDEGDEGDDAPLPGSEPITEVKTSSFLGNQAAEEVWEGFAPLHAIRELDKAGAGDEDPFGFDEAEGTLSVERRSGTIELTVGGETYGSKDRYLGYDSRVFLVDDKTLRPLQYGKTRLIERMLHPIPETDADTVQLTAGARSVTFLHKNKDDRAKDFWASSEAPTEKDDGVEVWLGKVMRMRVASYVDPVDAPADLTSLFTYTVQGPDGAWTVEVLQESDEGSRYYARSTFTRSLVELTESLAAEAAADVESVLPAE